MFKIRIGKLYVDMIQLNSYTDETELRFTADFNEAKKFNEYDYFYVDIIKHLLETDNIAIIKIVNTEDSDDSEDTSY